MPAELSRYLQLPDALAPRIAALGEEIAGSQPSAYQKVLALQSWMGANTRYTLDIPPLPYGADTVEQFLFVDKRGFCQQIASSLAVLLRTQGVPARMATGFAPGEWNRERGTFDERESDAHAWVEVWFPGIGWQGFDPTAEVPLSGQAWVPPQADSWRVPSWVRSLGATVVAIAVAGIVVVGAVCAATSRARARRRTRLGWHGMWARIEREGANRGRPRAAHETVGEYLGALAASVLPDARLAELARPFDSSRFAESSPGAAPHLPLEDLDQVRQSFAAIVAAHPRRTPRLRWPRARDHQPEGDR